jgi:hypothetical protein
LALQIDGGGSGFAFVVAHNLAGDLITFLFEIELHALGDDFKGD